MTNIDINCFGDLRNSDTIQIVVNGKAQEYNREEILMVLDKLSGIQHYLIENLVISKGK